MDTHAPDWLPPHCPNPDCRFHRRGGPRWRYKRKGWYRRLARPQRIRRFTCLHCGRNFSSQTFSTTYWQRMPQLAAEIFLLVVGGMANRQIARAMKISPTTVQRQISRLGRHCMLFHAKQMQGHRAGPIVVVDGFETFEFSQYLPFHHNVAVEADTGFFLFHTDSPLRRKGRMTAYQKNRREELETALGRPDPKAVRRGMQELFEVVTAGRRHITIHSDDHPAYPPALPRDRCRIRHLITPGREHRDTRNSLWEVNLLDLLIRHSTAAHRRETIAWVKRRQASAEKLTILQVWRNNLKRRWEKGPPITSAMLKGVADRMLTVRDVLKRRLFRTRAALPPAWSRYYDRAVETVALEINSKHALKYAY